MRVAMIDNYDSFTFNLVHYLMQTGADVKVYRNDKITVQDLNGMNLDAIVISPGPGRPSDAGISMAAIQEFSGRIPILGVCLGHQAIAECFGGKIIHAKSIMHGKTSLVTCNGKGVFAGINKPFQAMRYHSLAACPDNLPDCLEVTATTEDKEIMGIQHISHPTYGVQFHPESIMTSIGKRLIRNFVKGA